MAFLIDGYNLLFAAGFEGQDKIEAGTLDRARRTLLNLITDQLSASELSRSVIVFDAKAPPPNAADGYLFRGLSVRFARDHAEADDLIIELIKQSSTPHRLRVVSSDNQIRLAAARRRSHLISSEDWIDHLETLAESTVEELFDERESRQTEMKLKATLSEPEVEAWLREFENANAPIPSKPRRVPPPAKKPHSGSQQMAKPTTGQKKSKRTVDRRSSAPPPRPGADEARTCRDESGDNRVRDDNFDWGPFPPGYGEELEP